MPGIGAFFAGAFGFGSAAAWTGAAAISFGAGASFAGTVIGGLTVKLLTSVAITALQAALMADPAQGGGVTISTTLRGEDNPETIILGRYATAGQCVYVNSHGTSHRWLTHVVEVCSAPGATLNRLMLGGQWVTLATTPLSGYEQYGLPVTSEDYEGGYVFVKYYDGSQTTADAMLVSNYGADPDRPWATTAVGAGICYAILTFYHDAEVLPQIPAYRFELDGMPLYDIRKDSTRGGSGPQRLATPSTWAQTNNAAVMIWNVMRGIPLPGGEIWGGGFDLDTIPTAVFTTAMNRCDAAAAISGGTEPAYRAGYESALTQEPAATVTELLKACSGTIADMGYAWTIAVGSPALPVYAISDEDVIVSKSQTLDPFPSLGDTYNAVSARYPSPAHLWESHEAPLRTDAAAEASDVFGRRTASLTLPAVPYGRQVQRLTRAWLKDSRRFIRHIVNVPPDAAALDMADTLDWTSVRNGYNDKTFSFYEIAEDLRTCIRQVSIRERDPSDYDWDGSAELPSPPTTVVTPKAAEGVSGFNAFAATVVDAAGNARRAAIEIVWNPAINARGIRWELRLAGQTTVRRRGDTQRLGDGSATLTSGVLPATSYEVRSRLIAKRKTVWTAWFSVTTDDIRIGTADLADPVRNTLSESDRVTAEYDALVAGFNGTLADAMTDAAALANAGLQGWLMDPTFRGWTGTPLNLTAANWASRSGTSAYAAPGGGDFGGGMLVAAPSGSSLVEVIASSAAGQIAANAAADYVVLTLHVDYISGNNSGAFARIEWSNDGTTWTRGTALGIAASYGSFAALGLAPNPGVRQAVQVLWKRPSGVSGYMRLRLIPKLDTVADAQDMRIHLCNVGPATQAQIDAGREYVIAGATPGTTTTVAGIGEALAQTNANLITRVSNNEASITTTQTALATTDQAVASVKQTLSATANAGTAYFYDTFNGDMSMWEVLSGTGEVSAISATIGVGPKVLRLGNNSGNDTVWIAHKHLIPFDPNKTYKMTVRGRQTLGAGTTYAGFVGVAADGVTLVNISGANSYTSQHYHTLANTLLTTTVTDYSGYTNGRAAAGLAGIGTVTNPSEVHTNVAFLRPMIIANYNGVAGALDIVSVRVDDGAIADVPATVEVHAGVISGLTDTAMLSMRTTTSGGTAAIELVSSSDPSGPATAGKFLMENMIIESDNVLITNAHRWTDRDMAQPSMYFTTTAASYYFIGTTNANLGLNYLVINPDAATETVYSNWFSVAPSTEYLIEGAAWMGSNTAGLGSAVLYIQTGAADTANAVTLLTTTTVKSATDVGYSAAAHAQISLTTGVAARRMRWAFSRPAGGTGSSRYAALSVEPKVGATLMVDGLVISKAAQIQNALIDTAHIKAAAVSTLKIGTQAVSADWNSYTSAWTSFASGAAGSIADVTIADATTGSAQALVTFTAQVGMTKTTAGRGEGTFTISNGVTSKTFTIGQYLPAGAEIQVPVSITAPFTMPASGNATFSVSAFNSSCDTFRFSKRNLSVKVFKR